MSTMQIVFSIIGLVLIAAIVGHGVWTIRRNEKLQRERVAAVEQKRQRASSSDFDDDGIGEVRVVKRSSNANEQPCADDTPKQAAAAPKPSVECPQPVTPTIRATDDEAELDLPEVSVEAEEVKSRAMKSESKPEASSKAPQKTASKAHDKDDEAPQPTQQSMDLPLERNDD